MELQPSVDIWLGGDEPAIRIMNGRANNDTCVVTVAESRYSARHIAIFGSPEQIERLGTLIVGAADRLKNMAAAGSEWLEPAPAAEPAAGPTITANGSS